MQVVKPPHDRFVFKGLDDSTYSKYCTRYSQCKRYGYRGIVAWATGAGVKNLVIEIGKGTVRKWGRNKLGIIIIFCCAYVATPALSLITNSTKMLNYAKTAHTVISSTVEYIEDSANLAYLPFDMILFGQPIPIGEEGRLNLFGNDLDPFNID